MNHPTGALPGFSGSSMPLSVGLFVLFDEIDPHVRVAIDECAEPGGHVDVADARPRGLR